MVVILYKRNASPDDRILDLLESALTSQGIPVFIDRHLRIGVEWAQKIEESIRAASWVIAILSDAASGSEMLEYELETAADEFKKRGSPNLIPIKVGELKPLEGPLASLVNGVQFATWQGPSDDDRLVREVLEVVTQESKSARNLGAAVERIEATGGAVPATSKFYTLRDTDADFEDAIRGNESVILVKGPRQIGKTSLIGRGVALTHRLGWRCVTTDFQVLSSFQLLHEDHAMRVFAAMLARQTGFYYDFEREWLDVFGPSMNLDHFMRAFLEDREEPLVWFMDEADRIFVTPFSNDFFGVVRSWHNARARDPKGPWGRFTVVIGYATEARLFIRDLNQSPFNVGRQIALKSFTIDQTADLNDRYGKPIDRRSDLEALQFLLSGQPFLTRKALELLATGKFTFSTLMDVADRDDGPFTDHLRRILVSVSHNPSVLSVIRSSLAMRMPANSDSVERLLAAGVLRETQFGGVDLACDLYTRYLARHIP
ncbi:MAG: AAA-like domain-containing protein [Fimbriimonas sp.]|nr:AAA-like domain-containing protein [Fimbriimonas sp.]